MTLLPVVERELRVAARGRNTYRARFHAALITVVFSAFSLWIVRVFFHATPIPPRDLFLALTWIEFAFVVIAGFSLTCDSISEEKRDSTLGLLFLTDLKGYDIVLGKLTVAAVRGVYALLATVPVLALPLMLGGTNLAELSRTALTLLITLFFSMAVGLAVSAMMRRGWTAFGLSGFLLFIFALVLPLFSEFVREYFRENFIAHLIELPSPSYALIMSFRSAIGLAGNGYVLSLTIITTAAVLGVLTAAYVTPHVWKDRPPARRMAAVLQMVREWKFGRTDIRDRFRRRLLEVNPIFWLSRRERVSSFGMLLLIAGAGITASWFASREWPRAPWQAQVIGPMVAWMGAGIAVHVLILLRLAVLAAERFGEDRRSGALELILSTPMSIKAVLAGHWMALRRYFAGPVILAMGIQVLVFFLFLNVQAVEGHFRFLSVGDIFREIWQHLFVAPIAPSRWEFHFGTLLMMGSFPVLLLDWIALAWLSTWFSLRVKHALAAPIAALLVLHLPPCLLQLVIALALEDWHWLPSHSFSAALVFYTIGLVTILGHQLLCLWWSRRQIKKHFRTAATDRYQAVERRWWWPFKAGLRKVLRIAIHVALCPLSIWRNQRSSLT